MSLVIWLELEMEIFLIHYIFFYILFVCFVALYEFELFAVWTAVLKRISVWKCVVSPCVSNARIGFYLQPKIWMFLSFRHLYSCTVVAYVAPISFSTLTSSTTQACKGSEMPHTLPSMKSDPWKRKIELRRRSATRGKKAAQGESAQRVTERGKLRQQHMRRPWTWRL